MMSMLGGGPINRFSIHVGLNIIVTVGEYIHYTGCMTVSIPVQCICTNLAIWLSLVIHRCPQRVATGTELRMAGAHCGTCTH